MRKKFLCCILAGAMIFSIAACGNTSKEEKISSMGTAGKDIAENMSLEELVKAAQEEAVAKDTGTFMVYSPTSRVEKALNAFAEE